MNFRLNIHRDQLYAIHTGCMTYMIHLAKIRIQHTNNDNDRMIAWILFSLITEVDRYLSKKLLTDNRKFNLNFPPANAIAFYFFLRETGISKEKEYLVITRQKILDILHRQIIALPEMTPYYLRQLTGLDEYAA